MRSRSSIGNYIVLIRDLVSDVEDILDDGIEQDSSLQWKNRATGILRRILGKDHTYVREFDRIEFSTPFFDDFDELLEEETFRIGLEDARSYLISLIDELESEHNCTPGLMDMESLFAEMNRYVLTHVGDPMARSSLHNRITRLRNGMMAGDISGDEVRHHMEHIGFLDTGLYKRMVPLLTWYYIQGAGFKGAHNN